jgi:hypothetical protein
MNFFGMERLSQKSTTAIPYFVWPSTIPAETSHLKRLLISLLMQSNTHSQSFTISPIFNEGAFFRHPTIELKSSFCIGYGTRASMRNYEKLDGNGGSQVK